MAPDELASAHHFTANRGGAVGGAAAVSSEPPGLRRPETSHPPAGRPEPRTTLPALQIAGAGGKRPALRDGSPAPDACRRWLLACLLSLSLSLPSSSPSPPMSLPRSRAGVVPRPQPRLRGGTDRFWYLKQAARFRFCVDYRKVNAVSKFDAYPMPWVDELLDRLGTARIYSTLDLTKGYWQIPLSKEKSAFIKPFGLHQFVTLPFGLFGAPATFQHLMDKILRPHTAYAAAYLDDIIIYKSGLAAAYGAPAGTESAERGTANGQPKEVCYWACGGSVSGFPLGSRTGASPN